MRNCLYSIFILSSMLFTTAVDHYLSYVDHNDTSIEWVNSFDGEDRDVEDQLEEYQIFQAASLVLKGDRISEFSVHTYQLNSPYVSFDLSDRDTPPPRV